MQDVSTTESNLDGRALEIGQVLTGEGKDRRGVLRGHSDVVGSRCLVSISRTPKVEVGGSTESNGGFYRLMSRTVFTKTNRIVRSCVLGFTMMRGGNTIILLTDPDDLVAAKSRQPHGTRGI